MLRCGIDMIEIERVEAGLTRFGERFLHRFFTAGEVSDCNRQAHRLAARFAAKEAAAKALGTGIGDVRWQEIEIRCGERGRPVIYLYGAAAALAQQLGLTQWEVSLTHTAEYASAVVVAM